jgi:hypothetical protein
MFVSHLPSAVYKFCKLLVIILLSVICIALHQKNGEDQLHELDKSSAIKNEIWTKSQFMTIAIKIEVIKIWLNKVSQSVILALNREWLWCCE